jgi:hypothetical protein
MIIDLYIGIHDLKKRYEFTPIVTPMGVKRE